MIRAIRPRRRGALLARLEPSSVAARGAERARPRSPAPRRSQGAVPLSLPLRASAAYNAWRCTGRHSAELTGRDNRRCSRGHAPTALNAIAHHLTSLRVPPVRAKARRLRAPAHPARAQALAEHARAVQRRPTQGSRATSGRRLRRGRRGSGGRGGVCVLSRSRGRRRRELW